MPDDVSKKSLKVLDKKLQLLAEHAEFHVNINSVVGGGIHNPQDALVVGKRAVELGFTSTVGIIHDGGGQLQPLARRRAGCLPAMRDMEKSSYARINYFQDNIAQGRENQLALPRGRAISLHLRGWAGALLLAAARLSRQAARPSTPSRISGANSSPKRLRAPLHGGLRPPHVLHGFLARAAEVGNSAPSRRRSSNPGSHSVVF